MTEIKLVITFTPENNGVSISGPIQDRFLCYGMLAMAQEIVANQSRQQPGKLVPVAGSLPKATAS